MAACAINNEFIREKLYKMAFSADESVIIVDDAMRFSNHENMVSFKESVDNLFTVEGVDPLLFYDDNSNVAVIHDVGQVTELYDFENPESNDGNDNEYVLSHVAARTEFIPDDYSFYTSYLNKMENELEKVEHKIKELTDEFRDSSLSPARRNEVKKLKKEYSKIRQFLKDQMNRVEFKTKPILDKLIEARNTINTIINDFDNISDPHIVMTVNNIIEDVDGLVTEFGDKKYQNRENASRSQDSAEINTVRGEIHNLKIQFDRKMSDMTQKFLEKSPILMNDEEIRRILANPQSEEYKRMFGGAAITDIGFLEFMGLNVDTSSTFDGVLGQFLVNEMDRIGQDNNNMSIKKKKELYNMAQKFKRHGINLELSKDTDFLYEKDKQSNKTGNFQRATTFEFNKKLSDFYKAFEEDRKQDMIKMLREDLDIIDFFKFGFMYKNDSELNALEKEFKESCYAIFREIYGNDNEFSRNWLHGHDEAYEREMMSKFDSKTIEYMKNKFMSQVIDFRWSYSGDMKSHAETNPFEIIKAINKIKNGGSITVAGRRKTFRFNNMTFIPKKEDGYNKEYQRNFLDTSTELGRLKKELYEFVYDFYSDFNLLYGGKNFRASMVEENSIDQMADAVRGIAHLTDVNSNLMQIKKSVFQWLGDMYRSNEYFSKDGSKVALNYKDKAQNRYKNIRESLDRMTENDVDDLAKKAGISKSDYHDSSLSDEENEKNYKMAIARKMSLDGFSGNFYVTTMKSLDLYYAQKTRNEMYPVAKMIERQYNSYTNKSGNKRDNANKRMADFIQRSIQKLNMETGSNPADTKLSNITLLRNMVSRFDQMPVVNKIINKSLLKKMSDDEKMLYNKLKKAKEDIESRKDLEFTLDGVTYKRVNVNGDIKYYRTEHRCTTILTGSLVDMFYEKLSQYYDKRMSNLGSDATLQNLVNLIRNLLLYKMLAGVSTSGLFNRIEGHLANSEMDATGYYWTPGNLNYVERYFFGSWLNRYINRQGGKLFIRNEDKKHWKRLNIIEKMSQQTNIFQDMKNQFDKTIEGEQKGVIRHNLDLFQLSVGNPEFKNQMSIMLSVLIDTKIKDKKGVEHSIFDKKTGEFTCFDIVNNELVLKDDFDTEENRSWVTFQSTVEKDGKAVISPSFEFAQKCKIMIKNIHGDYRQNTALGYNNNMILSHLMMLKRWLPSKVLRGWSVGGTIDDETGEVIKNRDIMWHKEMQSGIWFDTLTKGRSPMTVLLPVILSTTKLHKGLFKTAASSAFSMYMVGKVLKSKLGARPGEIEHNVSMAEETLEMTKALFWEILAMPARMVKMDVNLTNKSFAGSKFEQEYGAITIGNFRACARTTATYVYLALLGILVKLLFWHPEDGDDDDRRKMYNWIDNNLANILESITATMYMIDNFEDKADVSNIPIIRWSNDLGKFFTAVNEMDSEKAWRYANKVFMPVRFPRFVNNLNPFESDFEYEKDTPGDRWIKNIRTEGEWGNKQDYKHIRADIKQQYIELWNKKKLPDNIVKDIESMDSYKKLKNESGYDNIYELPSKIFNELLTRSNVIPSRKMKQYKNRDYKFMKNVLLQEYENNDYLKNHTLRFLFSGYDNRLGTFWQRNVNSDFANIKDNPYFDEE